MFRKFWSLFLLVVLVVGFSCSALAADVVIPKGKLPIFLTSAGQSPDDFMVRTLLVRQGLELTHEPLVAPEAVGEVATMMFAIGGSAKGLGDAGIDDFEEAARLEAIISNLKKRKDAGEDILLVGIHIGGQGRRGAISQRSIDTVSPQMDLLVVWEEGNDDGLFTKIAEDNDIPLIILNNVMELQEVFFEMFD